MRNVHPLGDGKATHVDEKTIEATFALGMDMDGYKMVSASIDESGYFLTIRWEREDA
jgi:hypothetical protein